MSIQRQSNLQREHHILAEFQGGPWDGERRELEGDVIEITVYRPTPSSDDPEAPAAEVAGYYRRKQLSPFPPVMFEWRLSSEPWEVR